MSLLLEKIYGALSCFDFDGKALVAVGRH